MIGQGEVSMTPNFIMMFQNGARELNLGTSFLMTLDKCQLWT